MKRNLKLFLVLVALVALMITGPRSFAKISWQLGYVKPALKLIREEQVQAVANYKLGDFEKADALFASVGRGATYDRALSLAMTGKIDLAIAYFQAVLFADQWDEEAQHSLAVLEPLSNPVIGEAMGHGRISALLKQQSEAQATKPKREQERIGPPIEAKSVDASQDWLDSLQDAPGEFLKKRLKAEYDARYATGTVSTERSPW